jgi:phosphatidylglycerophosphate synthase
MPQPSLPRLMIVADSPEALTDLCGISLLERTRRNVRQLGFCEAMILSNSIKSIGEHVARQSWHGGDVSLEFREGKGSQVTIGDIQDCLSAERVLVVCAGFYCDGRLLRALARAEQDSVLIDSDTPAITAPLWKNTCKQSFGRGVCAAVVSSEWFSSKNRSAVLRPELESDVMSGRIAALDAAKQQTYVPDMRRSVRPVFFPAPSPEFRPLAERLLRDATQSGVLDFPALVHAPIEKWLVSHLCRTTVTPNQITLGTGILGLSVTLLYAFGYLWTGALLALLVGILDGVDGKLARLKIQMTKTGKGEHVLDYFVEMSWWGALAHHFHTTGQVHYAYVILGRLLCFRFGETRREVVREAPSWSKHRRRLSIRSTPASRGGSAQYLYVAIYSLFVDWRTSQRLHRALLLGNGDRRNPHLSSATNYLHVPQQNCRSDLVTQARCAIVDSNLT